MEAGQPKPRVLIIQTSSIGRAHAGQVPALSAALVFVSAIGVAWGRASCDFATAPSVVAGVSLLLTGSRAAAGVAHRQMPAKTEHMIAAVARRSKTVAEQKSLDESERIMERRSVKTRPGCRLAAAPSARECSRWRDVSNYY
jgi:hypothetical protein